MPPYGKLTGPQSFNRRPDDSHHPQRTNNLSSSVDRFDSNHPASRTRGLQQASSLRVPRSNSLLNLRNTPSPTLSSQRDQSPSSQTSSRENWQHARNLSLQNSLQKPLPQPPPSSDSDAPSASSSTAHTAAPNAEPLPSFSFPPRSAIPGHGSMDPNISFGSTTSYGSQNHGPSEFLAGRSSANTDTRNGPTARTNGSAPPWSAAPLVSVQPRGQPVAGPSQSTSAHLSGLMCNVYRTTGRRPPALVGASTTIVGDKLYVFGGRTMSHTRPAPLTSHLYELDLIRRHWTKLEPKGDMPPPRYFHSMCVLGDTKMVCYGGMSPSHDPAISQEQRPELGVLSDIYIYDAPSNTWTFIPTHDAPQGRYAHCACILPSTASFSSTHAPLSALQHNPSTGNPNEGRISINIDGSGGAQMVIVGGQDGANHYIEKVSIFNLRSLKWVSTYPLGKSCGVYRTVAAAIPPSFSAQLRANHQSGHQRQDSVGQDAQEAASSMLLFSNYNFLDVKLEMQAWFPDGTLTGELISGTYLPPGLRFPNGGVLDNYFLVSGTHLSASKQEYALWALDLRTLSWCRIDAGGNVLSQGSWNRGMVWNRRNMYVVLGHRRRDLVDDYNHRRTNFSNVCVIELEAFGFYDNPRKTSPLSGFISASSPYSGPGLSLSRKAGYTAGGRTHSRLSQELGEKALALREISDMDILCIGGERIPISSRIVSRRWGPYFVQLLREGAASQDGGDAVTLRPGLVGNTTRSSSTTVKPQSRSATETPTTSTASTSASADADAHGADESAMAADASRTGDDTKLPAVNSTPTPRSLPPGSRPRCLYLPHTYLTVQALLHFLYTSALPSVASNLCTPQILCSLLQVARPYRVDGLLEAVVERLHIMLDSRNAAAVFNAAAMAAGGGRGIDGSMNPNFSVDMVDPVTSPSMSSDFSLGGTTANESASSDITSQTGNLSIEANAGHGRQGSEASSSINGSEVGSEVDGSERDGGAVWNSEMSSVIGLQKRGLRGLMEGRRMRERTGTAGPSSSFASYFNGQSAQQGGQRVGLGIDGS